MSVEDSSPPHWRAADCGLPFRMLPMSTAFAWLPLTQEQVTLMKNTPRGASEVRAAESSENRTSHASDSGKRIHLAFSPSLYEKIKSIQEKTHAGTITEVVRNALLVYSALVNEREKGSDIVVRSHEGKEKSYEIFLS